MPDEIAAYNAAQDAAAAAICASLRAKIDAALPEADSKVWHPHPVWFLQGNPVVGYARRKTGVTLLFWSGQSFDEPDLRPEGKFKAAEARFTEAAQIDPATLQRWLAKARAVQWDYKNIVKRKGALERLEMTEVDR